ncbi:nucleoside hydrolase [Teredinibacter turnerae]|uniref:nucleoside hydrolase n=1 Tax=Teredinibacter turnerae TaxID=2426 RepID=UPI00037C4E53|nr:nucleoside hydrolase [Teredinibacter turnerae]
MISVLLPRSLRHGFSVLLRGVLLWQCVILSVQAAPAKRKVILDDDGFGVAQWMVVQDADSEVLGVTQVSGNRWLAWNTQWALRALELANRSDIPVYSGAVFPLLNTEKSTHLWEQRYGKLIWKGAWQREWVEETEQSTPTYHAWDQVPDLPEGNPGTKAQAEHAANFMIRMVHQYPGEVSIIATGPLTNIALAQSLDPAFASLAKELVYMGGSLQPQQTLNNTAAAQFAREFINSPRREFNWRWDPEAVRIALRAPWRKIVMVPVDPSTDTQLTPALLKKMSRRDNALSKVVAGREPNFPLWDEIATGVWLDEGLIANAAELYIDCVSEFGPSYGDTLSWSEDYRPHQGEQLQMVVKTVDVKGLEKLMIRLLNQPLFTGQ